MATLNKTGNKAFKLAILFIVVSVVIALLLDNSDFLLKLKYPLRYQELVVKYSKQNNIDPYFVYAVIKAESGFNPNATSNKDARGLMQITRDTGNWIAQKVKMTDYSFEKLYEPEINICLGCWYLKNLLDEFNDDYDLVAAAYNGGRGNVNKWLKNKNLSKDGTQLNKIPFKETETFVSRVKNNYKIYIKLYENKV